MREDMIGSKQSHELYHHHHGINVVTEHAPPLPEHPGESLNSIQALQSAERRKDENIKDEEY